LERGGSAKFWEKRTVDIDCSKMSEVEKRLWEDFSISNNDKKVNFFSCQPIVKCFSFKGFLRVDF
jgi:hypothetical protein